MNETRMQTLQKVADNIISQGAHISFTKEHFGKEYSWTNSACGTQEKYDSDDVSVSQGYLPEKDSNGSKKEKRMPNLYKHFWHCIFQHPGQVVLYEWGKFKSWVGRISSVSVRISIASALVIALIGLVNNKLSTKNISTQMVKLVVESFVIGFVLTVMLLIISIIVSGLGGSTTLLAKVFHYRPVAPLWFTIWTKEEGKFIAYDYWFDPLNNELNGDLNDGLSLVTGYSQEQLNLAYLKLSALEKFLIIPDTYSRRVFYPEPLTEIDQAELDYDNKREEVRLSLYKKMKDKQTNFLSHSVSTIFLAENYLSENNQK